MDIILVSSRLQQSRVISLKRSHIAGGCVMLMLTLLALAALLNYATLRYAAETRNPRIFSLFSAAVREDAESSRAYLRDNLDAMSARLGELQAQILRLDTLGERVARLAGFKSQELALGEGRILGRTSDAVPVPAEPLSFVEFSKRLNSLARQIDERGEKLGMLDSLLMINNVKKQLLPSVLPLRDGAFSSAFGWRPDPFHGGPTMHEGMDLTAAPGTPILAAAAGVVITSEYHSQYGNMVEIDHGNGLVTRYAHCSRRLVKVGDVVMKGAAIGEVGSSGRATGPHLHFEVRQDGVAQNPARFLRTTG